MDIEQIRKTVADSQTNWQRHALTRMLERNISRDDVKNVISKGEIIEEYPNDYPLPSCLMFYMGITPLHVVLSYNETNQTTYIITAYKPDLNHFEADLKTRRRRQ